MFMSLSLSFSKLLFFPPGNTLHVAEARWSGEGGFCRAIYRVFFNQKLKVAPPPVRLFCTYMLYDKLSKILQHTGNVGEFLLPWSPCPLYALWKDNSDLERNGLGWSPSCEPGNEEWEREWGRTEGTGSEISYEKAGNYCSVVLKGRVVKSILRENTELSRKWKLLQLEPC